MLIAIIIAVAGIIMAWLAFKKYDAKSTSKGLAAFFENKWYVDEFYHGLIVTPLKQVSMFFEKIIEKSGIDAFVNGIGKFIQFSSNRLKLLQNGLVGGYLFLMVIGVIILFIIQVWVNKF